MSDLWARCEDCQTKLGGVIPKDSCITVSAGDCEECGAKDVTLIPTRDYNWPDGRKAWFD